MAQNVTFDLANTPVPAGTLKMQVTVDLTGFPVLTGSSFYFDVIGSSWALKCTGGSFLTELKSGGLVSFAINSIYYYATVTSITDDDTALISEPSLTTVTNLITNGTFADATGWTNYNGGTISSDGSQGNINSVANNDGAYQTATVSGVSGKRYMFSQSQDILDGTWKLRFPKTASHTGTQFGGSAEQTLSGTTELYAFSASETASFYVMLYCSVSSADSNLILDNVSLKDVTIDGDVKFIAYPTANLIFNMDEHVEKVDVKMGVYEYDDFTMEFADDYSFYNAGFWYYLFRNTVGTNVNIFIRLEESGVDSFVSRGNVNQTTVEFNEVSLSSAYLTLPSSATAKKIRTVKMSVVSGLDLSKGINIAQLMAEMLLHTQSLTQNLLSAFPYFRLIDTFNSAIKLMFDQTFDSGATILRNSDIKFKDDSTAVEYTYDYLWAVATGNGVSTDVGYLEPTSLTYWGTIYPTAFEVFESITTPFSIIPRYFYGQSDGTYAGDGTDKHRIELLSRGRTGNPIVMVGRIIDSMNNNYSPYMIGNIIAQRRVLSTDCDYFFNASLNPLATEIQEVYGADPPTYLNFDFNIVEDFAVRSTDVLFTDQLAVPTGALDYPPTTLTNTASVLYWNYNTDTQLEVDDKTNNMPPATARYYYYKFKGQATYNRTYSDVRSTVDGVTSQANTRCLRRHEITDEFETRAFYAIEVRKSYTKNTASIVWFEE